MRKNECTMVMTQLSDEMSLKMFVLEMGVRCLSTEVQWVVEEPGHEQR